MGGWVGTFRLETGAADVDRSLSCWDTTVGLWRGAPGKGAVERGNVKLTARLWNYDMSWTPTLYLILFQRCAVCFLPLPGTIRTSKSEFQILSDEHWQVRRSLESWAICKAFVRSITNELDPFDLFSTMWIWKKKISTYIIHKHRSVHGT